VSVNPARQPEAEGRGDVTSRLSASAGTSSLVTAMTSFMGSAANAFGLTLADMAAWIQKLNNSNGQI